MTDEGPRLDEPFRVAQFVKWSALALAVVVALGFLAARALHALGIE